jgi:hypothetical protein
MHGHSTSVPSMKGKQFADTSSDDDDEPALSWHPTATLTPASSTEEPWKQEFNHYLKGEDKVPEKMTLVQWWGVHAFLNHLTESHQLNSLLKDECTLSPNMGIPHI